MEFVSNHPIYSFILLIIASLNIFGITAIFVGVWQEGLREKVKFQSKKIINLLADISELKAIKERQAVITLSQSLEIMMLNDQLKEAKLGAKVMPYVESMTDEYYQLILSNDRLQKAFRVKGDQVEELKTAFAEASHALNSLQQAEKDNEGLRAMYVDCLKENRELKEQCKTLQETIEHKRHTANEIKSDWWTPKRNIDEIFIEGIAYKQYETHVVFRLWSGNKSYIVNKSDFMPCTSNGKISSKDVLKHEATETNKG